LTALAASLTQSNLRNCVQIGFHIRIPFSVKMPGTYSFRLHADYGRGAFVGIDGAEFTPGDIYTHIQTAPQSLGAGEHDRYFVVYR